MRLHFSLAQAKPPDKAASQRAKLQRKVRIKMPEKLRDGHFPSKNRTVCLVFISKESKAKQPACSVSQPEEDYKKGG